MRWSTTPWVLAFALICIARAPVAQDAGACADEVQRLEEGLPVIHDQASATAIAREPGARKGASLGEDQRRQVSALIEQARTAAEDGDGALCMQSLTEARALLREAGFGSGEPGSASTDRSGTGRLGSGTPGMAGDAGLPAPPRGAGAATTGMGGETTDRGPAVESAGGAAGGAGTRAGGGAAGGAASGAAGGSGGSGSGSGGGGN
jgi:hypothetical protein